ncbi:ABC transporter substrate-binding protein [Rhodococcus koreensis]
MTLVTGATVMLLSACSGGTGSEPHDGDDGLLELGTIRVAYAPVIGAMGPAIAQDLGLFDEFGLKVETVRFSSGPAASQAWLTDSADISMTGSLPFVALRTEGVDAKVITNGQVGSSGMVVARAGLDLEKGDYGGLEGLTLGTLGAQGAGLFRSLFDQAGLDQQDMKIVTSESQGAIVAGMQQNQIDLTYFTPPQATSVLEQTKGRIVFDCSVEPRPDYCSVGAVVGVAKSTWLEDNPKQAEGFIRGMGKLYELVRTDPDRVLAAAMPLQDPPATDLKKFREATLTAIDAFKLSLTEEDLQILNTFAMENARQAKDPVVYADAVWPGAPEVWADYPNADPKPPS